MALHNDDNYLIGQRVKVENEKEIGVVTRIDFDNGLICVLFKRMREVIYNYPEALENNTIKLFLLKK
ncbi:hypothetical protein CPX_001294 [Candidatus Phytoplasma pruni]|uniref:Uncharacterized protein n=1 Tax=Candidatus Phytoplasma pruni TaxID=479893 RepID=A0A0M1N0P6_9MOLU|nr:hypothetical protein [Candidatus Phytoplasma pruni]KOR75732.1 hypothetical protein CPX_001294 [Candidatus Phytoplasma pruni]MCQ9618772.1 hypothetical protein [Candidatus Phytoplasma pruni]MDW3617630.1 hypothetical protein [Candidatus Phytoplasma pruni]